MHDSNDSRTTQLCHISLSNALFYLRCETSQSWRPLQQKVEHGTNHTK